MPLVENCLAGFNSSVFAYGQVTFFFFKFCSVVLLAAELLLDLMIFLLFFVQTC